MEKGGTDTLRASKIQRRKAASDTESDTKVQPKKRRATVTPKSQPQAVALDSDSDGDANPSLSRHKSVKSSEIYKNWDLKVPELRKRYQIVMLIRDGFPCKT